MSEDRIEGNVRKFAGAAQSAYGETMDDPVQELKGKTRKAAGKVQAVLGEAEDHAYDTIETVQTHILEKPLQSALIALGIGFLIGKLF